MRRPFRYIALAAASIGVLSCAGDGNEAAAPTGISANAGQGSAQAAVPASIGDSTINAVSRPSGLVGDLVGGLLGNSQPLPLFVCQNNGGPYTGSATIGVLGGVVTVGPHKLTVPPLAVFQPTHITAQTYAGDTIAVTFQPQGLKFLLPATLSLDYSHCSNKPTSSLQIDYLDNLLQTLLSIIPSLDNGSGQVTGQISHFSVYAASEARR
jgi:hypothetical protein